MQRHLKLLTLGMCANALVAAPAMAQSAPEVTLTRLATAERSRRPPKSISAFSDTYSLGTLKTQFVFSCYLIKHGDQYMMWDTGHSNDRAQCGAEDKHR
jgi:hypothetical protein